MYSKNIASFHINEIEAILNYLMVNYFIMISCIRD